MYYRSLLRKASQLNAFLMKIFLDLQIISHSLQGGYQSSLKGLFFGRVRTYTRAHARVCVRARSFPISSAGQSALHLALRNAVSIGQACLLEHLGACSLTWVGLV